MLAALFPVLALVATTQTFAAPLEARQDAVASASFAGNNVTATATGSCGRHGRHRRPRPSASTSVVVESTVPSPSASAASEVIESVAPSPVATSIIGNNNNAIVTSSSAVASSSKAASSAAPTSTQAASSAAPAPSPMTGAGSGDAFIDEMLKLHNDFRAQYGAGPLTWNADAAAFAQGHASKCVFEHSKDSGYGENLAAGVGGGYNAASGFNAWAGEASLYDYNNPGFSSATGHFTQVVWKGTTEVGCAFVECDSGTLFDASYNAPNKFLECNYKAPGNYQGQFPDNVGKKV